jgi:hypothetical protein
MSAALAVAALAVVGGGVWLGTSGPQGASAPTTQGAAPAAAEATAPEITPVAPPPVSRQESPSPSVPAPAVAAKPAEPVMVSVSVVTVPDGVEIRHEGNLVGTTPAMVTLERGEAAVQILLTKGGFEAKVVELVPSKNQLIKESLVSNAPSAPVKSKVKNRRSRPDRVSKPKPAARPAKEAAPKPKKAPSRIDDYLD